MESDERLISEQLMELRGLARRTANLKMEVVKGIIQGSEFNPKLAKHAPLFQITVLCFTVCFTKCSHFISFKNSVHFIRYTLLLLLVVKIQQGAENIPDPYQHDRVTQLLHICVLIPPRPKGAQSERKKLSPTPSHLGLNDYRK